MVAQRRHLPKHFRVSAGFSELAVRVDVDHRLSTTYPQSFSISDGRSIESFLWYGLLGYYCRQFIQHGHRKWLQVDRQRALPKNKMQ